MSQRPFAELLAAALDAGEISPRRAAEMLSVHHTTVYRWLAGAKPLPEQRHALARLPAAVGMSAAESERFLAAVAEALGYDLRTHAPNLLTASTFSHRRHLGTDDLAPFAGRAAELTTLQRHVLKRQSVLITGMGGMGKTRLAQELLRTCANDFTHGCDFLSVAPGQNGAQVIRNVAHLLSVELQPEELTPGNRRLALDRLNRELRGVSLLFLVDNVEEAKQVRDLAQGLRAITWVFTARRISLKRIGVHPLHLRPPARAEAIAIFRAHLKDAPISERGDDQRVGRIADKVGGLPYALRLAAAVLSNRQASTVAELDAWLAAEGLGRGGSPTRKLERFFDAMLDNVPASARRTLLLCGAFPMPTIRIAAAQSVGEAAGARPTPIDWVALEDYSLVEYPDHEHVSLHARLHTHLRQRLTADPAFPAVRAAFAAHYLALVERVSLGRADAERDYRPLIPEAANLTAAADAFHTDADWTSLRRLWPGLTGYLWTMGDLRGYERVDRLCLEAARAIGDVAWESEILAEIGYVKKDTGEWAEAEVLFLEAQALHDASPDQVIAQARLRRYRAEVALGMGESDRALSLLAEADQLLGSLPVAETTLARKLLHSARMTVYQRRGELAAAEAAGRETERLYEQLVASGRGRQYADFYLELGDILFRLDRVDEADARWRAFLTSRDGLPHLPAHAEAQVRLAWLAAQQGDSEEALRLAVEARHTMERHGRLAHGEAIGRLIAIIEAGAPLPEFAGLL